MAGHTGRYEVLCSFISNLRKEQSITQQVLASRLGKPQSFVSKIESGERKIDVIEFIEIVDALKLDPVDALKKFYEALPPNKVTRHS